MASSGDGGPVRVEVIESVEQSAAPLAPGGGDRQRPTWLLALALAVVVAAAVLWWVARPDPGFTAADDPIATTTTTTLAPSSTASATSSTAPGLTPVTPTPTDDGYARAPLPEVQDLVALDDGWLGTGFSDSGRVEILRSTDGLVWTSVPTNLPDGGPIALDRSSDGTIRVAVATADSISTFASMTGERWVEEGRHELIVLPSLGAFSGGHLMVGGELAEPGLRPLSGAADYLRDVLAGPDVDEVCELVQEDVGATADTAVIGFRFLDCEGQPVFEVAMAELAETPAIRRCLTTLSSQRERSALALLGPGGAATVTELPLFALVSSIVPVDGGFVIGRFDSRLFESPVETCFGASASALVTGELHGIDGSTRVIFSGDDAIPSYFATGPDGSILRVGESFTELSREPFTEWSRLEAPGDGFVVASVDGRVLAVLERDTPRVLRLDEGPSAEWQPIDIDGTTIFPFFADDDYVFFVEFAFRGPSLVRVPVP